MPLPVRAQKKLQNELRGDDDSSREMQTRHLLPGNHFESRAGTTGRDRARPEFLHWSRQALSSSRIPPLKRRDAPLLFSPRARPRRKIDTFEDDYWCSFASSAPLLARCRVRWSRFPAIRISVEVIVSRATFFKERFERHWRVPSVSRRGLSAFRSLLNSRNKHHAKSM